MNDRNVDFLAALHRFYLVCPQQGGGHMFKWSWGFKELGIGEGHTTRIQAYPSLPPAPRCSQPLVSAAHTSPRDLSSLWTPHFFDLAWFLSTTLAYLPSFPCLKSLVLLQIAWLSG